VTEEITVKVLQELEKAKIVMVAENMQMQCAKTETTRIQALYANTIQKQIHMAGMDRDSL
jgi:hypothetical protein